MNQTPEPSRVDRRINELFDAIAETNDKVNKLTDTVTALASATTLLLGVAQSATENVLTLSGIIHDHLVRDHGYPETPS